LPYTRSKREEYATIQKVATRASRTLRQGEGINPYLVANYLENKLTTAASTRINPNSYVRDAMRAKRYYLSIYLIYK